MQKQMAAVPSSCTDDRNRSVVRNLLMEAFQGESLQHVTKILCTVHTYNRDALRGATMDECLPHLVHHFIHAMKSMLSHKQMRIRFLSRRPEDAASLAELAEVEASLGTVTGVAILAAYYIYACLPVSEADRPARYAVALALLEKECISLPRQVSARSVLDALTSPADMIQWCRSTLDPTTNTNVCAIVNYVWASLPPRCPVVFDPHGVVLDWTRKLFDVMYFDYAELSCMVEYFCDALNRAGLTDVMIVIQNAPPVLHPRVSSTIVSIMLNRKRDKALTKVMLLLRVRTSGGGGKSSAYAMPTLHLADLASYYCVVDATLEETSAVHATTLRLCKIIRPEMYQRFAEATRTNATASICDDVSKQMAAESFQALWGEFGVAGTTTHLLFTLLHFTRENDLSYAEMWQSLCDQLTKHLAEISYDHYIEELRGMREGERTLWVDDGETALETKSSNEQHKKNDFKDISLASGILAWVLEKFGVYSLVIAAHESRGASRAHGALSEAINQCAIPILYKRRRLLDDVELASMFKRVTAQLASRRMTLEVKASPSKEDYLESTALYHDMKASLPQLESDAEQFLALCVLAGRSLYFLAGEGGAPTFTNNPVCIDRAAFQCYYSDVQGLWKSMKEGMRTFFSMMCANHSHCVRLLLPDSARISIEQRASEILTTADPRKATEILSAARNGEALHTKYEEIRRVERAINATGEGVLGLGVQRVLALAS